MSPFPFGYPTFVEISHGVEWLTWCAEVILLDVISSTWAFWAVVLPLMAVVGLSVLVLGQGDATVIRAYYCSKIIGLFGYRTNIAVRRRFRTEFRVASGKAVEGHSHPNAAAQRGAVDTAIESFAIGLGLETYTVSSSSRSRGAGSHQYYMAKDLLHEAAYDAVEPHHLIKMVDVDYYVSVGNWLKYGRPLVMYTFAPKRVAGVTADGVYTIEGDEVRYHVKGGATYQHPLWDYDHDFLMVDYWWGSWVVSVDYQDIGEDRRVVCLVPETKIYGPLAWTIPGKRLARKRFERGGVNVLVSLEDQLMLSLGVPGEWDCVTYPYAAALAAATRFNTASKPGISDIERLALHVGDKQSKEHAALLYRILTLNPLVTGGLDVGRRAGAIRRPLSYQAVLEDGLVFEDGKEYGREVAPSLVEKPAVLPRESLNNDIASVRGRVQSVLNTCVPPKRYLDYAREFVMRLVPDVGCGSPKGLDEVEELQTRPTQRARTERARPFMELCSPLRVSAFQKQEAYGSYNDPRMISQCNTTHMLQLSQYTYSFKEDCLKHQPWYAPGKTPRCIAERVVSLGSGTLCETDYSRFDGTISRWLRVHLEQAAYLRWVSEGDRSELCRLLEAEVEAACVTKKGVTYVTEGQRLSGSPLTTDGNTIINAYVSFAAAREAGFGADEAWQGLGVYAGDDGISRVSSHYMERAAARLGLRLKCREVRCGSIGFLGRIFPRAYAGELGSIQDPARTLAKLHITVAPESVDDRTALRNRAAGYLALDPAAPVVGTWCKLVQRLFGRGVVDGEGPYMAQYCAATDTETWPQLPRHSAVEVIADSLELTAEQVEAIDSAIAAAGTLDELAGIIPSKREMKIPVATGDPMDEVPNPAPTPRSTPSPLPRKERRKARAVAWREHRGKRNQSPNTDRASS
uniref:RNA-directed RNA polymerase n=1 Tax=Lone star tick nodavirus TaxID=2027377 RepID=A0A223PR03_9VIRU|nr:polymerase [Lone star tick nodavirus]